MALRRRCDGEEGRGSEKVEAAGGTLTLLKEPKQKKTRRHKASAAAEAEEPTADEAEAPSAEE